MKRSDSFTILAEDALTASPDSVPSPSMLRAAEQLALQPAEEGGRKYLTDARDIDDFIPTTDDSNSWLQCNAEDCEIAGNLGSIKLVKLKRLYKRKTQSDLNHPELLDHAMECKETSGKWILKTTQEHADELWRALALSLLSGSFGSMVSCVKCSTRLGDKLRWHDSGNYTLCVYTDGGWTRKDNVMRLRRKLHELGVDKVCVQPLYWKPDLYTMLPLSGMTYLWVDGVDTEYWFDHWKKETVE